MFHLGSHASLGGVLALGFFIHSFIHMVLVFGRAASHILCLRCSCANGLGLALIAAIAQQPRSMLETDRIPCRSLDR